jgi:hypothetical protein
MLICVGCLGLNWFFSPNGGCVDNDTIVICCCPIIPHRNTCIYTRWILASGVGICHVLFFCAIMALSIILWLGGISGMYVLYIFHGTIKNIEQLWKINVRLLDLLTIFHEAKYLAQWQYCWTYYVTMQHNFFSSSRVSETSAIKKFAQLPKIITLYPQLRWAPWELPGSSQIALRELPEGVKF